MFKMLKNQDPLPPNPTLNRLQIRPAVQPLFLLESYLLVGLTLCSPHASGCMPLAPAGSLVGVNAQPPPAPAA